MTLTAGTYTETRNYVPTRRYSELVTITEPAALTAAISAQTNVLCNGGATGSATVTPAGGTSPYTYSWSPSERRTAKVRTLAAQSYRVTLTDANGSTKTATATITEP